MNDKEIEKQIHDIIEGEIQNNINEYLEKNPEEQKGFDKDAKLNVGKKTLYDMCPKQCGVTTDECPN